MKISGTLEIQDDGSLLHIEKFSDGHALNQAEYLRATKAHKGGKLLDFVSDEIGEPQYAYPPWLEQMWAQKWGISLQDPALDHVIQVELNSGDYERFRI